MLVHASGDFRECTRWIGVDSNCMAFAGDIVGLTPPCAAPVHMISPVFPDGCSNSGLIGLFTPVWVEHTQIVDLTIGFIESNSVAHIVVEDQTEWRWYAGNNELKSFSVLANEVSLPVCNATHLECLPDLISLGNIRCVASGTGFVYLRILYRDTGKSQFIQLRTDCQAPHLGFGRDASHLLIGGGMFFIFTHNFMKIVKNPSSIPHGGDLFTTDIRNREIFVFLIGVMMAFTQDFFTSMENSMHTTLGFFLIFSVLLRSRMLKMLDLKVDVFHFSRLVYVILFFYMHMQKDIFDRYIHNTFLMFLSLYSCLCVRRVNDPHPWVYVSIQYCGQMSGIFLIAAMDYSKSMFVWHTWPGVFLFQLTLTMSCLDALLWLLCSYLRAKLKVGSARYEPVSLQADSQDLVLSEL